jgi:ubiquinone/menaquinone biosynthesis C-methylase UbiE
MTQTTCDSRGTAGDNRQVDVGTARSSYGYSHIEEFLTAKGTLNDGLLTFPIREYSASMRANSYYFGHPVWAREYLHYVHQDEHFRSLWKAGMGSWDNKVVVDICCAPGNLLMSLRGSPRIIIGVDISKAGLKIAQEVGYTAILADAHDLPLVSSFADIVTLNAALHHCDNMALVLGEAARLVRPGGLLITDRDQQLTSMDFGAIVSLLWKFRRVVFRWLKKGAHSSKEQQAAMLATEVHAQYPGDGVTPELYLKVLKPLGFQIGLYPHNTNVGSEALQGNFGRASARWRLLQWLSGIDPNSADAAMCMMCIAARAD